MPVSLFPRGQFGLLFRMFDCEDFTQGQVGVNGCCWEEAGKGQGSAGHLDLSMPLVR